MPYFDSWFTGHYWEDYWWDPATATTPPAPSAAGGISKSKILGTVAPQPALPPFRSITGPVGNALIDIRKFLADSLERKENFGNHVQVTFPAASTAVRVDSGLGGPPRGYKVVRADAPITVFDAKPPTPPNPLTDRGVLWLQADDAGTVTLYIY